MKLSTLLQSSLLLCSPGALAAYSVLAKRYDMSNFYNQFNFFTAADPTAGFVKYVDQSTASSKGYIRSGTPAYIGVDSANVVTAGRESVRLESKDTFRHGLFILDVAHMPVGCGTWPAYWTYGANWPNNGEIDIIEHVNQESYNNLALHTSQGCSVNGQGGTGVVQTTTCDVDSANIGCSTHTTGTETYGVQFNSNGGGVWAMEWNSDFIKVWFFQRGSIPSDVLGNAPEPASWGTPRAMFQGSCNIDSHFGAQNIVLDTTFCGSWAGSIWGSSAYGNQTSGGGNETSSWGAGDLWAQSGCAPLAATCNDYVAKNPSAFANAYWLINSLTVWAS